MISTLAKSLKVSEMVVSLLEFNSKDFIFQCGSYIELEIEY